MIYLKAKSQIWVKMFWNCHKNLLDWLSSISLQNIIQNGNCLRFFVVIVVRRQFVCVVGINGLFRRPQLVYWHHQKLGFGFRPWLRLVRTHLATKHKKDCEPTYVKRKMSRFMCAHWPKIFQQDSVNCLSPTFTTIPEAAATVLLAASFALFFRGRFSKISHGPMCAAACNHALYNTVKIPWI